MLETVQYATREEQGDITHSSRKNEEAGTKKKWHPSVDMYGGESKVQCYIEQYRIRTWNARLTNQDKLAMTKKQMARLNIYI